MMMTSKALMVYMFNVCSVSDNVKIDGAVLTIANVRPNNQGSYRCVATNAQGKATVTASLSVKREFIMRKYCTSSKISLETKTTLHKEK